METLRADQQREVKSRQKEADESRRQQQADAERVREVRRLASRFTIWAAENKIPAETLRYRKFKETVAEKIWRKVEYEPRRFKVIEKPGFWKLLPESAKSSSNSVNPDVGCVYRSVRIPMVNKRGLIIARPTYTHPLGNQDPDSGLELLHPPDFEPRPLTDDMLAGIEFRPEHIHQRVAELCLEHRLEVPDL